MSIDRRVALAGFFWVGCAEDPERDLSEPPDRTPGCDVPAGFELLSSGEIVTQGDVVVGTLRDLEAACAAGTAFPAPDPGRRGIGQASALDLWTDGIVPYDIDPTLPDPTRVEDAITLWEDATSLVFVDHTNQADFVTFTNGSSCTSAIGRHSGGQNVSLSSGKTANQIVGMGISVAGDVYTWYDDGMVTAGSSTALDDARAQYAYALPSGYDPFDIVAMAIANDGDVYTWYADGKRSIGSSSDLDAHSAPATYTLPPGKTAADIVEIDIAVDSDVYTWFDNSTVSIGTSTDLDAHAAPVAFTRPPGVTVSEIVGIAIANDGDVYGWYDDKTVSIGSSTDLDADAAPVAFGVPGTCGVVQIVHEIGHTIGLYHEQSHPDRDDYVRVWLDNVISGKEDNFCTADACPEGTGSLLAGDYDVTSRMHYKSYAFSADDTPTMVELATTGATVPTADVIDLSISPAGVVYAWWSDGTVTEGSSDDLELDRSRYPFTLPAGKTTADIVGIQIAKGTGNTYAFYDDGTRSIGSPSDLDSVSGPVAYTLPPGYLTSDIVAIDHAPNGRTYTWYDDGKVSSGTSTDLDANTAPTAFTLPPGRVGFQILGIAISAAGDTYAWYAPGDVSAGSTTDLDSVRSLYVFRSRGLILAPSDTLTTGDIAQVEEMYSIF